jgi:type II secretory pathway component PulF
MLTSDGQANVTQAAYAVAQGPVFRQALRRARDMQLSKQVRTTVDAFALSTPVFTKYQIGIMRTGQTYGQLDVKVGNIIDEERKRLNTMIELLPKKLESTFAIALTFIVGFLAYLMIIPTSYATAHIH